MKLNAGWKITLQASLAAGMIAAIAHYLFGEKVGFMEISILTWVIALHFKEDYR